MIKESLNQKVATTGNNQGSYRCVTLHFVRHCHGFDVGMARACVTLQASSGKLLHKPRGWKKNEKMGGDVNTDLATLGIVLDGRFVFVRCVT